MSFSSRFAFGLVVLLAAACSKNAPPPAGVSTASPTMYPPKHVGSPQHVVGNLITAIGQSSMGPFLSKRGTGPSAAGMVAWLTAGEGQGRRILVQPTDQNGTPRSGESVAAQVPIDTLMVILRPMRGAAPGFVVAWTELTDRGKALWSVTLDDNGKTRGKPAELTRSDDDITWVDVVPTDRGAVVLWAEQTRANDANLISVTLDTDGRVRESAARVAKGVVGWSTVALPTGIGLSTVAAAAVGVSAKAGRGAGALSFQKLDGDGHSSGLPVVIAPAPFLGGDVDMVDDGKRVVFAWTDRGSEEPAVALATLDPATSQVDGPKRVAEARGGADLLALASGAAGVGVMFEAPARRKDDRRHVHVAKVGDGLFLERPPFTVDTVTKARPELAATATGFTVLATALDCESDSRSCPDAPATATMWRTDRKMQLVQREPLNFLTDPASMGWGLTCDAEDCISLAVSGTAPARVRVAYVRPRVNARPVALPVADEAPPPTPVARVEDVAAVATGESILDLAASRLGEAGVLVATLGAKSGHVADPLGPEKTSTDALGTVSTRLVDDQGNAGPSQVVTPSALVTGGVALAFADKPELGGALAWVGRDNGTPQVHITRIDKRGRRQEDTLLTAAKGEKSDVTVTWTGNGYLVAWVDARDGNGEIYATKIQPDLKRVAREERITNAPGDASDLVAIARGDNVFLAWADPRESPADGIADVYVTAVKKHDAKRVFDEQRLLATAAHSRSPRLAERTNGIDIAWIEEAPTGSESPNAGGYGAFWSRLDDTGKELVHATRIPLAGHGAATAVTIDSGAVMHAIVARSTSDGVALDAVDFGANPPKSAPLLALDGPASLDVTLTFESGVLYFNDDGAEPSDRRARRARLAWLP